MSHLNPKCPTWMSHLDVPLESKMSHLNVPLDQKSNSGIASTKKSENLPQDHNFFQQDHNFFNKTAENLHVVPPNTNNKDPRNCLFSNLPKEDYYKQTLIEYNNSLFNKYIINKLINIYIINYLLINKRARARARDLSSPSNSNLSGLAYDTDDSTAKLLDAENDKVMEQIYVPGDIDQCNQQATPTETNGGSDPQDHIGSNSQLSKIIERSEVVGITRDFSGEVLNKSRSNGASESDSRSFEGKERDRSGHQRSSGPTRLDANATGPQLAAYLRAAIPDEIRQQVAETDPPWGEAKAGVGGRWAGQFGHRNPLKPTAAAFFAHKRNLEESRRNAEKLGISGSNSVSETSDGVVGIAETRSGSGSISDAIRIQDQKNRSPKRTPVRRKLAPSERGDQISTGSNGSSSRVNRRGPRKKNQRSNERSILGAGGGIQNTLAGSGA